LKKIVFGITNLNIGGAERTLIDICNKLVSKYDITIFTLYPNGKLEKELSRKINIESVHKLPYEQLNILSKILISLKIFFGGKKIYKRYIKNKYDVVIAFLEGPITQIFSNLDKSSVKKIAWIHNDISLVFGNNFKAKLKKILNRDLYKKYENLIFVSKDNMKKFEKVYNLDNEKEVIYNYIDSDKIIKKSEENIEFKFDKNYTNFLSVARLVEQKSIDRLINVHAKLINDGYIHKIYVIGDGPLRNSLEQQIIDLKVRDTFILLGENNNPYPYIKACDYFCLLSKFEGYGMVLEEAKILSKPILITDTAAREAVLGYEDSNIVSNDEDGIYNGIRNIIENKKHKQEKSDNKVYNNIKLLDNIINLIEN